MRDLLPAFVSVEVAGDGDWTGPLLAEEAAALSPRAVESRRREFTAGRVCARRALRRLGVPERPILPSPGRAPVWPGGVTGSITHTTGYCAAAVVSTSAARAVGIDAEHRTELPAAIVPSICLPEELTWCEARAAEPWWPAVHFSAKETVFKMWWPLVGEWLDFHDARLTLDVAAGMFEAHILPAKLAESPPGVPAVFTGRFAVTDDLVRTAGYLPA